MSIAAAEGGPRHGVDEIGRVETRGVDYIPADERNSTPREMGVVFFGAQMCFGIIVLGSLPVAFGLSWWASFWAITIGTAVGTALFGHVALVGPRTGTNSAVSSGAFFGVVGRIVGSIVVLFIAIGFYALAVWTGGQAIVAGGHRLFNLPEGNLELAIAYAIIGAITIVVALVGHATVVVAQKYLAPLLAVLLLIGIVVKLPDFHADYAGGEYLLGGFWPTWLLSAVTSAGLALSYGPFANDYARYIPVSAARRAAWMSSAGLFIGCWFGLIAAAYFTTMFADPTSDFIYKLVAGLPTWFAIPLVIVGLLGGCGQGAIALYGSGLDTSSLIVRLKRVNATLAISVVSLALVYLGSLVWNAIDLVAAFITLLDVVTAPWLVIIIMGHFASRGRYVPEDLQVFNVRKTGGAYWFHNGWNIYAITAWIPPVIIGMLLANTPPVLTGPWANIAGGVDLSFIVSSALAFVMYGSFLVFRRDQTLGLSTATGDAAQLAHHTEATPAPALRTEVETS
ncbi:purine-cytosine permease family protein [Mycolicibacterium pallens]|uniref:Cytosine permease n=1 Tax=Mycolicibacterium pallens TaxID=370524 RepID=A0ABX8VIJ5_9MYCO|nr:cytosine permease [Mycolicibacterium pallens]QYL15590.1 cytosine permease [Mycolicibacterium pallens]